jgi:hypothetical protein
MDERQWWESVAPDVTYCLGERLRPFSPGHWILLKRLESPLLTAGEEVTYADLLDAVFVCARKFQEGYYGLNAPDFRHHVRRWNRRLKWFGLRSIDVETAAAVMQAHIANGLRWPIMMLNGPANDKGADCASPMVQCLLVHLTSKLHQDFEKVLDLPFGACYRLYATASEMTGCARLTDQQEQADLQRQADDVQARYERGELKVRFN